MEAGAALGKSLSWVASARGCWLDLVRFLPTLLLDPGKRSVLFMPKSAYRLACIAPSLAALVAAPGALAQEPAPPPSGEAVDKPDRLIMIGFGPRLAPSFPGSTRSELGVAPAIEVWREDEVFPAESPDEAKGFKLVGIRNTLSAGLAVGIAPQRGAEQATQGLRKVGFGIEAGGFVESYILPQLRLRGEIRQGIGSHSALSGDVALDLVLRGNNDRAVVTVGPRVRISSAKYNRRFFGIEPDEVAASGLAAYRPGGGVRAYGLTAGAHYPLSERWGLYGFAGYDRLVGDAADSPLVRQRGSRDQASFGIALTHVFRIRR
jgi:outer membrane protein